MDTGNIHTVTEAVINQGGTVILTRGLRQVRRRASHSARPFILKHGGVNPSLPPFHPSTHPPTPIHYSPTQVLKLGNDDEGQTVTAQCGTSLLELHTWLGKKQLEVCLIVFRMRWCGFWLMGGI